MTTSNGVKFTHLHVHSHYSLLDGLPKIDQLLDYVKELKMEAVALTDHGNIYGAVEFYKKATERGIKPILGTEMYMALDKMFDKRPNIDDKRHHLVLLVKNEEGYRNLVKLITKAHLEGFYYKPRIDEELLAQYSKGLIGLSACLTGKIPKLILAKKMETAEKTALKYQEIFGKDNFYLELQHHPNIKEQKKVNDVLVSFSKKLGIPLVATNDVHYLKSEDAEAQDVLMLINTGADSADPERLTLKADDFSMRNKEQMIEDFKDWPSAIENTQKIADLCNFQFELGKVKLPQFAVPTGERPEEYLEKLCQKGLKKKFGEKPNKESLERLKYELSVIKQTGFTSYFLIVQDFVNWAKENRIVVGPGRGCLLADTKILLKDGSVKNIQDIKVGERIISHLGNKRKVKKVLCYDANEKIAIIKSKMPVFDLELTKNHKVLAARHQMCPVKGAKKTICKPTCNRSCKKNLWKNYKLKWIKAEHLKKNDFLVYPITKRRQINTVFDLLNFNNLDTHLKGDEKYVWYEMGTNKLIQKKVKRFIKLDEKLASLLGFYIAEGWSRTERKLGLGTVGFGFNKNEIKYITEVRKLLKEIFGIESSIKLHRTRNSCQVFGYSRIVARFLERICGKKAEHKHIPYQIFESSNKIIILLLTSLFKGDGSNKDTMRVSFDSTSYNLVSQVKMLLAQLGIMSSIKFRKHKKKDWHISYKLTISGKQLFKFNQLFKDFQIPIKNQKFYRNDTFIWKNYIWFPVKEIKFKKYKGKVYDLTIEKDTSYVANDIALHNSVGGSLVAYLLNITNIDPLKYNLLFERFLTNERISPPDIDLDFTDRRRDEVIRYVAQKYGRDKVAQIITFGTMAARAAVRDVGRAMGYTYTFCDQIAKMIPFGMTLDETMKRVAEFRSLYESNQQAGKLIDAAKKLEGVARHASTHACGVVISNTPLDEIVPLQHPTQDDQAIVTQYEMYSIEDLGLLKMDFLGLKNLTIIEDTLSRIYVIHGVNIDIEKIPSDDKAVFRLLQKGETVGVFQLESGGFQRYLKQLKPTEFEDIIAMVSLYRPGPIQLIPDYIARKNKRQKVEYLHPKLKPILESTYGIILYQEQVMKIAQELAGFTLAEADVLRKAIGKKIRKLLIAQKEKFIEGMKKNEIREDIAQQIWYWIEPFASYSFNRSHAAAYATIAYQTAYLKVHYPAEFMSSLLTSERNDLERIAILIEEAKKMGLIVLPPDINESFTFFSVVPKKNQIRFGLSAIKNVGSNIVEIIVNERKAKGPYTSLDNFVSRISSRDLNKKSLESLIKAGVFDKMAERNQLLSNLEKFLEYSRENQKTKINGQKGLFDGMDFNNKIHLAASTPASEKEKLAWEKELLGLFISSHPLQGFEKVLAKKVVSISKISNNNFRRNIKVKIGGIISNVKKIITKTGKPMLFVKVEDLSSKIEVVVFPGLVEKNPVIFQENRIVMVSGRLDSKDGVPKIICENIEELIEET